MFEQLISQIIKFFYLKALAKPASLATAVFRNDLYFLCFSFHAVRYKACFGIVVTKRAGCTRVFKAILKMLIFYKKFGRGITLQGVLSTTYAICE